MEKEFDYVAEASLTLSNKFHGELVSMLAFNDGLVVAIRSLAYLDLVKKSLFYGKDNGLNVGKFDKDLSTLPQRLCNSNLEIEGGLTLEEAENLIHGIVGIATEAGELLEALQAAIKGKPLDRVNIMEEVGDLKWYAAILAKVGKFAWGDDERANIAKIRARYPNKFTEHDAQNRNLSVERQILEKS